MNCNARSRGRTPVSGLLSTLVALLLCGCQSAPQTIGELVDRNGQSVDRLGIEKSTISRLSAVPAPAGNNIAISHYENVLRLAAAPETRAEALRRAADLRIKAVDAGEADATALKRAVDLYETLLKEFPRYPNNAHVLYQLARAHQLAGNDNASIASLQQLAREYPDSSRALDARFRAAEMLFVRGRHGEAAREYREVVALGRDNRYFDMAQYKYGWTQYQLGQYESALSPFLAILDRTLPPLDTDSPEALMADVAQELREIARDSLRAVCLSFAALDGGRSVGAYFARRGEPPYHAAIYASLGTLLLSRQRYTDAAAVYQYFARDHGDHALAPAYASRAIAAYETGGFASLALRAKESFADRYGPQSAYWRNNPISAPLTTEVRQYMIDIARHHHAQAQQARAPSGRKQGFAAAAHWYRRILDGFPAEPQRTKGPQRAELNLLYADALFDAGDSLPAAQQYAATAYGYPDFAGAPGAALAAVKAFRRHASEVTPGQRNAALQQAIDASRRLAEAFPAHPQRFAVLLGAAEDLYALQRYADALAVTEPLRSAGAALAAPLRIKTLSVIADSHFALGQYPQAETAYAQLLPQVPAADTLHALVRERLAVAIYRQAETARAAGEQRRGAELFLHAAAADPTSALAANATYDAAALLAALKDWTAAAQTLERFREQYPTHTLLPDADKLLASAYQQAGHPALAAAAYARIAGRPGESEPTRRSAALLAAQLFDHANRHEQATAAYEYFVSRFPHPLQPALEARRRLADIARGPEGSKARYRSWLRDLIDTEQRAGTARDDISRSLAAQASLELALDDAATANTIALTQPLAQSLARRKGAMETALASLDRAAAYGIADVTTAATHELGALYRNFAAALLKSPRPKLDDVALEQYQLMLEEQAYPFEEKAIAAYLANLQRLQQGVWNTGLRNSVAALGEMVPARYGKQAKLEDSYDSLH